MKTYFCNLLCALLACAYSTGVYAQAANQSAVCSLSVTITITDATAPQAQDGSATANPASGTAPYSYVWNNGQTTAGLTNVGTGWYRVTVTDAANCTATATARVSAPGCDGYGASISYQSSVTPNSNSVSAAPIGGTSPYSYAWSTGNTDSALTNLPTGIYCVTITDATGCTVTACAGESKQPTGINNIAAANQFSLYPNPVQNMFTIELTGQETAVLTLATLQGKVVQTRVLSNGNNTIPVATLPNGTYLVNILSNWQWQSRRLVVQH